MSDAKKTDVAEWVAEFDLSTSTEALAAWGRYQALPLNPGAFTPDERAQDAFTAAWDASKGAPVTVEDVARAIEGASSSKFYDSAAQAARALFAKYSITERKAE